MSPPVTVEYVTDPLSGWCWAAEPVVRRLRFAFEDVEWRLRLPVLLPSGGEADAEQASRSLGAARESTMPTERARWAEDPPSSRPACAAVAAVSERDQAAAWRFLRRVLERVFALGAPPRSTADLVDLAEAVAGVDPTALERDLRDGTAVDALEADLERVEMIVDLRDTVETRGDVRTLPAAPRGGPLEEVTDRADGGGRPVVAPPVALFRADDGRVLVAPGGRYDRLKGAVTTLAPEARSSLADPTPYGDKELKRRGMLDDFAEQFVDRDYEALVERYLDRFGRAFLPEVVEGVDATRNTCRLALNELASSDRAEREPVGEWTAWRSPGGR